MKSPINCSKHQEFFGAFFYGVPANAAQLCNVRQRNACLSLAKNPSSRVLSRACFSRTSFLLCLLQLNLPSPVCLSLSPVSTLTKRSFMGLPQQNTVLYASTPASSSCSGFLHWVSFLMTVPWSSGRILSILAAFGYAVCQPQRSKQGWGQVLTWLTGSGFDCACLFSSVCSLLK